MFLPAGLFYAWYQSLGSHLTELDAGETELTHISPWATRYLATVVQADWVCILRDALQLASCLVSLSRIIGGGDGLLEGCALLCITGNELGALHLAGFH